MRAREDHPHVAVTWGDAYSLDATAYVAPKEARKYHRPMVSVTTGWLIIRDLHGVTIMGERQEDLENGGYLYRGHTFIPAGMIKSIRIVRGARKAKSNVRKKAHNPPTP